MKTLRILLLAAIAGSALYATGPAAWADDPPPAPAKAPPKAAPANPPPASLNLAPPDIHRVLPQQDIEGPLVDVDTADDEPAPEVKVAGDKAAPDVPEGQIAALWWGLTHPVQAWRIFAPVQ